jgi:hypothetical protein
VLDVTPGGDVVCGIKDGSCGHAGIVPGFNGAIYGKICRKGRRCIVVPFCKEKPTDARMMTDK